MQNKSLELVATADDKIDDKAKNQLTQGACHQQDAGMEEALELVQVVPIFYKLTFLEHICDGQHKYMETQFWQLIEVANIGNDISVQFYDIVLYKLVGDYFYL